jgi:hypothetical protein
VSSNPTTMVLSFIPSVYPVPLKNHMPSGT